MSRRDPASATRGHHLRSAQNRMKADDLPGSRAMTSVSLRGGRTSGAGSDGGAAAGPTTVTPRIIPAMPAELS